MATVIIELEIEGDANDAVTVVDEILDWGSLQDEIAERTNGDTDHGPLNVTEASCRLKDSKEG